VCIYGLVRRGAGSVVVELWGGKQGESVGGFVVLAVGCGQKRLRSFRRLLLWGEV
jgi:hypothetical protein